MPAAPGLQAWLFQLSRGETASVSYLPLLTGVLRVTQMWPDCSPRPSTDPTALTKGINCVSWLYPGPGSITRARKEVLPQNWMEHQMEIKTLWLREANKWSPHMTLKVLSLNLSLLLWSVVFGGGAHASDGACRPGFSVRSQDQQYQHPLDLVRNVNSLCLLTNFRF